MSHHAQRVKSHKHRYRERELDVSGSTCASAASYDPRSKELTVTFIKGNSTYVFDDVGRRVAKELERGDFGEVLNEVIL